MIGDTTEPTQPIGNEEHSQAPKPIEPDRVRSLKRRAHTIRFIRHRGLVVHVISRRLSEGSRNVFTAVESVCVRGQDQGMRHFNGANTYSLPSSAEDAGHLRAVKILIYQCQGTMRFFNEFCVLVLCHFTSVTLCLCLPLPSEIRPQIPPHGPQMPPKRIRASRGRQT